MAETLFFAEAVAKCARVSRVVFVREAGDAAAEQEEAQLRGHVPSVISVVVPPASRIYGPR